MKKIIAIVLLLAFACLFVGCVPKTTNGAAGEKMNKKGYNIVTDDSVVPMLIYAQTNKRPNYLLIATKDSDALYAFAFKDKDEAEAAKEYVTIWANKKLSDAEVKQSGAWLYFGTEQAVKDFK